MAKNIIFCADGTWDSPLETEGGRCAVTNIYKMFSQFTDNERQIVKYDDGLASNKSDLIDVFEGMTGFGLIEKIIDGYEFIMTNYHVGDNIFLFGFSRGAYTVRFIAAIISHFGLLKNITTDSIDNRRQKIKQLCLSYKNNDIIDYELYENVLIKMIGVFDTVGALGIPLHILSALNHKLFCFEDSVLSHKVLYGYQALAIDERRSLFTPALWDDRDNLEQVWFIGSHADVGGGYADFELANITLNWMLAKAVLHNVILNKKIIFKEDSNGIMHKPWQKFPFNLTTLDSRLIIANSKIHQSVTKRNNYAPANLPQKRTITI